MQQIPDNDEAAMQQQAEQSFNRGVNSLDVGDLQGARTGFAVAAMLYGRLEQQREFAMATLYLADTLANLELADEALENYRNALEAIDELDLKPELEASTRIKMANAELMRGELETAEQELDRAAAMVEKQNMSDLREMLRETREDLEEATQDA